MEEDQEKRMEFINDNIIEPGLDLEEITKFAGTKGKSFDTLNIEELKVLMEYFDTVFDDFEKEKSDKTTYEEANKKFKEKLDKINILIREIFNQIDDLKTLYNLSKEDIKTLYDLKEETENLNKDYKILIDHTGNNTFAYSRLTREIENLFIKLVNIEERLDISLNEIGTMHDDEQRAREQLEEMKIILKDAKAQIRDYNLPIIPKKYYVELNEAQQAIKEIIVELEKTPIDTETLNTRVDTARDLVFKLLVQTKEMMKTAMFAEMAIVYGNRYRSEYEELDKNLTYSESLFFKGDYKKSLEIIKNALNRIDNTIYDKLLKLYEK